MWDDIYVSKTYVVKEDSLIRETIPSIYNIQVSHYWLNAHPIIEELRKGLKFEMHKRAEKKEITLLC